MKYFTIFWVLLLVFSFAKPPKINSTSDLVAAMQKRYAGKWCKMLTFTQYNTHYENGVEKNKSVWLEAIAYPDRFRIDFGDLKDGNAVIFARDSVFNFKGGENKSKRQMRNNLMLLAGGIYFYSQADALQRFKEAGYNTDKFREDVWNGEAVYVVGADKTDLKSNQCWIHKKKLYLLRTLETLPDGKVRDAIFSKHTKTAGGYTETEVLFLVDGQKQQLEIYTDLKVNPNLNDGIFRAESFGKTHWKQ